MVTWANIEDPDEMPRNVAFHQDKIKTISRGLIQLLEMRTCDPLVYTMDRPRLIVLNQMEELISTCIQRVTHIRAPYKIVKQSML